MEFARSGQVLQGTELWDVTCHVGSHCVTCYLTQVNTPRPNPSPAVTRRDGRLSLPSNVGYPAMERPGVELATSRLQVRCPNHYTTEPPSDI